MQSVLLGTTKGEERENLKNYILANKKLLDILDEILYNMYRDTESAAFNYDTPSWPYQQAHLNGKKEVILNMRKILNVT